MCHRRACERLRISELKNAQHLPLIALVLFHLNSLHAQSRVDTTLFRNFKYRNLGPFRAGAWISDIAVPENPDSANRFTFYVAARNGADGTGHGDFTILGVNLRFQESFMENDESSLCMVL